MSRVDAKGKKFDPNLHEAVYQEESEHAEPGTVIAEFQKGYVMDGRLAQTLHGVGCQEAGNGVEYCTQYEERPIRDT